MQIGDNTSHLYQELAEHYEGENKPRMRDAFLLLAAEAARRAGQEQEAERIRLQLLFYNPHHLLKPYPSYMDALESPDVQFLLEDLQQKYPVEVAQEMLSKIWEQGDDESEETVRLGDEAVLPLSSDVPGTMPVIDMDRDQPPQKKPPVFPMPPKPRQSPPRAEQDAEVPKTLVPQRRPAPMPPPPPEDYFDDDVPKTLPPQRRSAPQPPEDYFDQDVPKTLPLGAAIPSIPEKRPRSRPIQPRQEPTPEPVSEAKGGAWFATLLMLVIFIAGLAGLVLVLLEPFLGW